MVHLSLVKWVGLLPRVSISIDVSILWFGTLGGIVSSLPTLETSNVTQVLLGGHCWVREVLIAACSIPISIPRAVVVMLNSSIMVMASMVMGKSS